MSIPPTELERLHRRVQELVPRTLAFKPCYYWGWQVAEGRKAGGWGWAGHQILSAWVWYSNVAGDYIELKFWGTILGLLFEFTDTDRGIAYVYIDGKKVAEIDLYAPSRIVNRYYLIATDLEDEEHTVRVEVSGLKNPSSTDAYVSVQGIFADPKRNPNFLYGSHLEQIAATSTRLYYLVEDTMLSLETTTPLGANAEYVGQTQDRTYRTHAWFHAMAYADVDGTIYIDQSHDGTNWDLVSSAGLTGGAGTALSARITARYIRIRYLNGAVAQTTFRFGRRVTLA